MGKTALALELARYLGTEIVGADSMQVYRHMVIGTGQPTAEQRRAVPHHLVDYVHPTEPYSAGRYKVDAEAVLERLLAEDRVPLVVGGTGLYVRVLVQGLFQGPPAVPALRRRLKEFARTEGLNALFSRLKQVDPSAADRIHPHDERRLIRALEVYEVTGRPISALQEEERLRQAARFRPIIVGLTMSRNRLYERIDRRVDAMIRAGLVQEVRALLEMGVPPDATSMQGLGYKEMIPYLEGQARLEQAVQTLKQATRHYAKRQLTWFRADPSVHWLDVGTGSSPTDAAGMLVNLAERLLARPRE